MTSGTGTATTTFSQAGNANYNPATSVVENTTAQKANQTITVGTQAPGSATYNTSFNVAATSDSGLPVAILASGGGSGSGTGSASVTMTSGTGTATTTFSQAGNANYNPATSVVENTTAQKATLPVLAKSDLMLANQGGDDGCGNGPGCGDGPGEDVPRLTGTVNGTLFTSSTTFKTAQGDTLTVSLSSSVTSRSPVGVYAIVVNITGSASANYVQPGSANMYVVTVGHDSGTGAKNVSFWDNNGNSKLITGADLAALDQVDLENANGSNFDPTVAPQLQSWLRSDGDSVIKSLSIQLATMDLNILAGYVKTTDVVYAGDLLRYVASQYSVTGLDGGGFITVGNLMMLAENSLSLYKPDCDGDYDDDDRLANYLDALEDALEAANDNTSFVQQSVPSGS
jgi:hypothetical protein